MTTLDQVSLPAVAIPEADHYHSSQDAQGRLKTQSDHLQTTLSSTLRLLGDRTIDRPECPYETPVTDPNHLQRIEAIDGRHLDDLNEIWHRLSPVFAVSEEEAAVSFTTWFVHDPLWPTCHQSRSLVLFPQRHNWDSQIRALWRDKIQPGQPFEVSVAHPRSEHDHLHHILVHQGIDQGRRGILLSSFLHDEMSHLHHTSAVVTSQQLALADLLRCAGFQHECQTRSVLCVGFLGRESLEENHPLVPTNGAHFELHIVNWDLVTPPLSRPMTSDEPVSGDNDVSSLMHVGDNWPARTPRSCGINLPEQAHESTPFQFHVDAPAFVPGIPWDLNAHDEFIQDLFEAWNQIATAWEGEERSCSVLVWFVDHQWPHPHGHAPRRVNLQQDLHDWRRQLWQAWQDQVILGQELEFQLVTPLPYTTDRSIAAHVIIIQRPIDTWVTSIVTLFDERALQSVAFQMAITTHEHILIEHLSRVLGIEEACFGNVPVVSCLAWYKDLSMRPGAPIPGRSGMSIDVLMRHLPVQTQHVPTDTEAHSLLSISRQPNLRCPIGSVQSIFFGKPHDHRLNDQPRQGSPDQRNETVQQLTPIAIPTLAGVPVMTPPFAFEMLAELQADRFHTDRAQQDLVIRVWYVHHVHRRMSRIARFLHLAGPPQLWQSQILALWFDRIVPFEMVAIHVVKPRPFRATHEQHLAFDLILSQGLDAHRFSGLVSVYPTPADPTFPQFAAAISFRPQVSGNWIVRKLAFQQICQDHRCQIFHRWNEIPLTSDPVHLMSGGDGFAIHIYRQEPMQPDPPPSALPEAQPLLGTTFPQGEDHENEGPVLLQLHSLLVTSEQTTDSFSDGIEPDTPIRLIGLGDLREQVPSYVTIPSPPSTEGLQRELGCFGPSCQFALAANSTVAICIPETWPFDEGKLLLLFTDMMQTFPDERSAFLTLSDQKDMTEIQLMALLHRFGYEKAVIQGRRYVHASFVEVLFQQAESIPEPESTIAKQQRPWPECPRGDRSKHRPMWDGQTSMTLPSCLLDLGLHDTDLQGLFHCENDYLCRITEGLQLPDVTREAISGLHQHTVFDRLIIYVDGSSQSRHKHIAPARNEEIDVPDAWSFVVLGETVMDHDLLEYTLLGWHAHQVRYSTDHPWFLGATHVGSAIAEREALTWAFLWRIGLDSCLPTVFSSDSLLAIGQADGSIGPAHCDQSFQTLRGCYQILQSALRDDVAIDHVFGHMNEPWNEMADVLAKQEARSSFFLPRPQIDLPRLLPKIPFLWMIFDHGHGLPSFVGQGFDIRAPSPPPVEPPAASEAPEPKSVKNVNYKLSIATANVQSLGAADQGFAGKLDYLRAQFTTQNLNIMGVQESRSSEGVSKKQGVLRLCSGHAHGKWGVELWIFNNPLPTSERLHFFSDNKTFMWHIEIRAAC